MADENGTPEPDHAPNADFKASDHLDAESRAELREAVKASDPAAATAEAWRKIHARRAEAAEAVAGENKGGDGPGQSPAPPPSGDPEDMEAVNAALAERTDGALDGTVIEGLSKTTRNVQGMLDHAFAAEGEDGVARLMEKGEAEVLGQVYRGSEHDFQEGMAEINRAVEVLAGQTGRDADALREAIDGSGILANPQSHLAVLSVARNLLKRSGAKVE